MQFYTLKEFDKDLKQLLKKQRTLNDDLNVVKFILKIRPDERPPFSFRIDNLGINSCVIKVKKIASRSFKGKGVNSGFRLIYAYFKTDEKIIFIEIFHKSNKSIEDKKRIYDNFK